MAPPEARARFSQVERPLLPVKIKERLHQTIGSRETTVSFEDTPCDFIKSTEHVGPRTGFVPLPGRTLHQSNLCPTKGTKKMAAPRKGESIGGLVQDRSLHARYGTRRRADRTSVGGQSMGHVDRRRKCGLTSASLAFTRGFGLPEVRPAVAPTEAGARVPQMVRSGVGLARDFRRDPPLDAGTNACSL